jgi:hypothetical protein
MNIDRSSSFLAKLNAATPASFQLHGIAEAEIDTAENMPAAQYEA